MSQTLWQKWTSKSPKSVEGDYFNPLEAKVGARVEIDILDYRSHEYILSAINEIDQKIGGKSFKFADYQLKGEKPVTIRIFPREDGGFDALLLETYYDQDGFGGVPWHGDGEAIFAACTGQDKSNGDCSVFEVTTDGGQKQVYRRCDGKTVGTDAVVSTIRDENGDGIASSQEVEVGRVVFFDYQRTTKNEADEEYEEFLYIQFDNESKYCTMLYGMQVDPNLISLL